MLQKGVKEGNWKKMRRSRRLGKLDVDEEAWLLCDACEVEKSEKEETRIGGRNINYVCLKSKS
jgi:hypothetical protein